MRIAFVISSLRHGGPVTVLVNLVKALVARGHSCKVYFFDANKEVSFICPTERISYFHSFDFSAYDVIHVNGIRSNFYASLHIPPQSQRRYAVISTVHAYTLDEFTLAYHNVKGHLLNSLYILSLRRHDCIIALSKDMRQYLCRWIKPERLTWAYNGIDIDSIDHTKGACLGDFFQQGDVRMICNSALVKLKRVDLAIRSLCYLPQHYKLWINGEGDMRPKLEALCKDLHVSNRVHFAGRVLNPISYLKEMDVFIQCSMTEGFCLSMAKAAACRLPIVSSDIPGMREKFADEEVCYFHITDSVDETAQSIAAQIQRAYSQKKMGELARQKVEKKFSLPQLGLRYETIFERELDKVSHRK